MKNQLVHFFWLSLALSLGCASQPPLQDNSRTFTPSIVKLESAPKSSDSLQQGSDVILDKKFFTIHYDPSHRLARFVEYHLTSDNLKKSFVKRKDRFHSDIDILQLKLIPMEPSDYKYSGYDRGHLAPSGDFEWSEEANDSTFTMANIVPQKPSLNRVAWRGLEEQIREWAYVEGELRIVTGPLFNGDIQTLSSGVAIPQRFFKAILDETPPRKAIGFIFEQGDNRFHAYQEKVVTTRYVETLTGLNFFADLPSDEQEQVETHANLNYWHGEKCKGSVSANISNENKLMNFSDSICATGKLKSASIRGCCSRHGGVKGPKRHRACRTINNEVICQDDTVSPSCRCSDQ